MAGEYQEVDIYLEHQGKLNVTGEISIPELVDLVTAPLSENAIGMKEGVLYRWNVTANSYLPIGGDSTNWTSNNTFAS